MLPSRLGNLSDAGRFDDRRSALALGKARGFLLVGIDAAETFAIGVEDGYEPVMMLSATIFIVRRLCALFLACSLFHVVILKGEFF